MSGLVLREPTMGDGAACTGAVAPGRTAGLDAPAAGPVAWQLRIRVTWTGRVTRAGRTRALAEGSAVS